MTVPPILPPILEQAGRCVLPRGVLRIAGADAAKFLNGICTRNLLGPPMAPRPIYTGFLTAQGRILYDTFIYPSTPRKGSEQEFFLDCDARTTGDLLFHLKQYRLRSKITIADASADWHVQAEWETDALAPKAPDRDTRCDWNMRRRLVPRTAASAPGGDLLNHYHALRMLKGIPEGAVEIARGRAISVEYNLDLMGGVDLHKGCYLGQELVTRTLHRGVVRKRVIPVILYDHRQSAQEPFNPDPIKAIEGLEVDSPLMAVGPQDASNIQQVTSIGSKDSFAKLIAIQGNLGLALARLENIPLSGLFAIHRPHPSASEPSFILGRASIPTWWPADRPTSAPGPVTKDHHQAQGDNPGHNGGTPRL